MRNVAPSVLSEQIKKLHVIALVSPDRGVSQILFCVRFVRDTNFLSMLKAGFFDVPDATTGKRLFARYLSGFTDERGYPSKLLELRAPEKFAPRCG